MTSRQARRYGTMLSIVLALLLTMALAACRNEGDPVGEETPGRLLERAVESEPTQESADPEEATDEPRPAATRRILLTFGPTSTATDREALVALYNATDGPNWDDNENWTSDAPLGEWDGVSISDDGRVTGLFLNGNQLSGEIPPELGNLANLKRLDLYLNDLTGEIPPELGNLANLIELDLYYNQLNGEIPPELGNLANLTSLRLSENQLSGEMPPELGNLANLEELLLNDSQLSGEIPPELGNLANLKTLHLQVNQLSGEIPPELGNLANLTYLSLWGNQLSGCVPSSLGDQLSTVNIGDLPFC